MKSALLFLAFAALSITACNTNTTRRDMYSPGKASGPYSEALKDGTWWRGVKPKKAKATPAPKAAKPATSSPGATPVL